ncbi:lea domain protein [Diaporthe amygdali]|uniref:lea domain protein n=1 Tax=Phomopsis amygdali TaxID=1214568 RepID=UPI0022FDD273|nr:lea domain protein [Diaporthe amygdali]KAJ0120226.1 lea domain protein [Diaporthe amygdali]
MPFNDITKPPAPLPSPVLTAVSPGVSLLRPLSRRGSGPGMIILAPDYGESLAIIDGVPSPLIKWAEEGYTVVEIKAEALRLADGDLIRTVIEALYGCEVCEPKDKIGLAAYDPELWNIVAPTLSNHPSIVVAAIYADASTELSPESIAGTSLPVLRHFAGKPAEGSAQPDKSHNMKKYYYANASSYKFATPFQESFHYNTEAISHTRNLTLFKKEMNGPYFDLETIWDEHTYYEFADRSVEHTMSTMVQEPYVNHVPTMTGGIGRAKLSHFYQHNFIFNNSADSELELTSRTVGIDRVIDEFIFKFTHDQMIDWILPGVPPTNKRVEVPFTAVVNVRGDRLYHEHIAWDQGSVLRQLGLLPEYLPFPYPLPEGSGPAAGRQVEYRVPVAGIETANKMRDRNGGPSNEMFDFKIREV